MAFTYVTVGTTYETAGDLAASGTVSFTPVDQMRNGLTVIAAPVTATLDASGSISIRLAATTDPGTLPVGVTYKVVEKIVGQAIRTFYVSVPHNAGSTLELADLTVLTGSGGAAGFALRNATDYDDSVAPSDGQVMTWDSTTSKFHPEAVAGGGGAVSSVNGLTGAVSITATGLGAQPVDTDLTALAALTPADNDLVQRKSGAWTNRTLAQVKTDAALDQVDNTSDANKPLSTAATTALAAKAALASPAFTGTPTAPRFVGAVQVVTYAASVTLDASQATTFRVTATGDLTVAAINSGSNGQVVALEVLASGGTRAVSVAGLSDSVASGQKWRGEFSYNSTLDEWLFVGSGGSSGGGGGGSGPVSSVNGLTGAVTLNADNISDGTTNKTMTATERTKLAGIATGATANATDAQLRDRATHTGTQAVSSLSTTGTPSSTTFLRGDSVWATPPTGSGSGGVPAAARTVYPLDPPSGSGLTAIAANGSTNDQANLQAAINYVDTTWGAGYVIGPAGATVKCNSGLTIPTGVQLRDFKLDFSGMTGTGFAISVNDNDFAPLHNVRMDGPGKTSTVKGLNVVGTGNRFHMLQIRNFGIDVDLSTNNTYINTFVHCAIGESNLCVNQDFSTSLANNSGEKTIFRDCAFFNSNTIFYVTKNQGGVFVDGCSLDYSGKMGYFSDSHMFFTNCHIESNFVTTNSGYFFEPAFESRVQFSACNFIMGSTGGEGLRFIIRPNTGPSVNGRGRVVFDPTCTAYFVDTSHNGQQRWAEELLWIDPGTSSKTFETPFISNWNPVTAWPGRYQGDTQAQATITVSTGFSSGAQNGQVTVTAPSTVPSGQFLPVRIMF